MSPNAKEIARVSRKASATASDIILLTKEIDRLACRLGPRIPGLADALSGVLTKVKTIGGGARLARKKVAF